MKRPSFFGGGIMRYLENQRFNEGRMREFLKITVLFLSLLTGCQNAHLTWSVTSIPTVSAISRTDNGNGTDTVTISGSGYVPGTTASVSGIPCESVVVISSTTISCILPHDAPSTDIVVTTPGSGGSSGGSSGHTDPYYTVFATSGARNGNLGGLIGAHAICATAAANGSRTKGLAGNWRAIISTSTVNASSQISLTTGLRIKNTFGETVVTDSRNLWSSMGVERPVGYDENGTAISTSVWTNTNFSGQALFYNGNQTCEDWTSSDSGKYSFLGTSNQADVAWIRGGGSPDGNCVHTYALYCINSNVLDGTISGH